MPTFHHYRGCVYVIADETDKVRNQKYGSAAEAAKRRKMNSIEENSTAALKVSRGNSLSYSQ